MSRLEELGWQINQVKPEIWNQKTKIQAVCPFGHENNKSIGHYILGQGCDTGRCNKKGRAEEIVRLIFEHVFKTKFPKTRLPASRLEYDGYSDEMKLAFEYDGL